MIFFNLFLYVNNKFRITYKNNLLGIIALRINNSNNNNNKLMYNNYNYL